MHTHKHMLLRFRRLRLLFNKAFSSFKAILYVLFVLIFWHVLGALLGMQVCMHMCVCVLYVCFFLCVCVCALVCAYVHVAIQWHDVSLHFNCTCIQTWD
jgi:hypothetical protein